MKFERQLEDEERVVGDVVTYGRCALEVAARSGLHDYHFDDLFHRRVYRAATAQPAHWAVLVLRGFYPDECEQIRELVDWDAPAFNDGVAEDIAKRSARIINKGAEPALAVAQIKPPPLHDDCDRYGLVAIERITDRLRFCEASTRNKSLNAAAYSAAKLVRDGHASEQSVGHLQDIALALGLPQREVRATWKSGWEAGWSA